MRCTLSSDALRHRFRRETRRRAGAHEKRLERRARSRNVTKGTRRNERRALLRRSKMHRRYLVPLLSRRFGVASKARRRVFFRTAEAELRRSDGVAIHSETSHEEERRRKKRGERKRRGRKTMISSRERSFLSRVSTNVVCDTFRPSHRRYELECHPKRSRRIRCNAYERNKESIFHLPLSLSLERDAEDDL